MGTVYLARDTVLDRLVALKVPKSTKAQESVDRFFREAKSAAILYHPNICTLFEFGEVDGQRFLTMAYIEGSTLAEIVKAGKRYSWHEIAMLIQQVAETLDEAHSKGVIHRDLKPSNIMVNLRGKPIIMDFGLARRQTQQDSNLTQIGSVVGTPAYMSPEQIKCQDGKVDFRSDIYSLGVVFYELLTGRLPFEGVDFLAVLGLVLTEEPTPPSKITPGIPPELERICLRAMSKSIDHRYQTMTEMANDLNTVCKLLV